MHEHHIVPKRTYYMVFGALMVLTLLTVGAAYVDLGVFNDVVALLIASTKAALILFFFMHLRTSSGLVKVFLLTGLLWVAIMIVGTMDDFVTRNWIIDPGR